MNPLKSFIKVGLYYSGVTALYGRLFLKSKAVILGYHTIASRSENGLHVPPEMFTMHMKYLSRHYNPIPLRDLVDLLQRGSPIPPQSCVVTFDDGTIDNFHVALPILRKFSIPATFFVIGSNLTNPGLSHFGVEQAEELLQSGHEIGGHSQTHPHLTEIPYDQVTRELSVSSQFLKSTFSLSSPSFAYPYGEYDPAIARAVRDAGYCCAVTTRPGFVQRDSDLFALPRIQIDNDSSSMVASFATRLRWIPRSSSAQ